MQTKFLHYKKHHLPKGKSEFKSFPVWFFFHIYISLSSDIYICIDVQAYIFVCFNSHLLSLLMILIIYVIHNWSCVRFPHRNELHSYSNKARQYILFSWGKLTSLAQTWNMVSLCFSQSFRLDILATMCLIYAGSHIYVCEDQVQKHNIELSNFSSRYSGMA